MSGVQDEMKFQHGVQDGISWNSILHTRQLAIQNKKNTRCRMNTLISPDDGPGEVRNM